MKNSTVPLLIVFNLALVIAMVIIGCRDSAPQHKEPEIIVSGHMRAEIIEVDGCEYIFGNWQNGRVLVHKGNCKNPIHKNNQ